MVNVDPGLCAATIQIHLAASGIIRQHTRQPKALTEISFAHLHELISEKLVKKQILYEVNPLYSRDSARPNKFRLCQQGPGGELSWQAQANRF